MTRQIMYKILFFIALAQITFAQADFNTIPKIPLLTNWKKGESLQYELIKGKKHFTDTLKDGENEWRQTVTLSVAEADDTGYIIEAQYGSPAYFLPEVAQRLKNIDSLVAQYSLFSIRYRLKPTGEFVRLENIPDIRQMLNDMVTALTQQTDTTAAARAIVQHIKDHISSETYITEGMFQELRLYHQFHGLEYQLDQPQQYDTYVANMLEPQGDAIPAQASLNVGLREGRFCLFEHQLSPDATILKKLTLGFLEKMSGQTLPPSVRDAIFFDVKDNGRYAYHTRTGWLVEMLKNRVITTHDERQEEYTIMRLLQGGSF